VALFTNEARFFQIQGVLPCMFSLNKVGDPPFFYISDITNSSSYSTKSLRKKSMFEKFRANVLK